MKVIIISRALPPHLIEEIQQIHKNIEVIATEDKTVLERYWSQAEIIFGIKIDAEILGNCKKLRWIQTAGAGVGTYLFPDFLETDIMLTNTRGMHGQTVSEHIFMLMLSHARNLSKYVKQQQNHIYHKLEVELLLDKRLLIVGMGGIGQRAAQIGNAFGMRVEGIAVRPKDLPFVEKIYTPDRISQALPTADYIVVAAPLTEKTKGMLGSTEFALMKREVFIVNIARGPIIDEEAMIKALQKGQIGGVGLDVFINEPLEKGSPLWDMENVIITPHIAGLMPNYLDEAVRVFCVNLRRYLEGHELENLVDKIAGY